MTDPSAASGLVIIDKPGGMTSHDVVARVRRLAGTRKVGHAGTLDPMATGVLVVGVNRATRLLGHLMLTEKAYDATIRLGVSTVTDDAEGDVLATVSTAGLDEDLIRERLAGFVGVIEQVPTAVSAVKVAGRRAHQLVRAGEDVVLEPRSVTIHELTVHSVVSRLVAGAPRTSTTEGPVAGAPRTSTTETDVIDVEVSVRCSSGTYIRAIARDLGADLGVGGHLTALRRTAVGPYDLTVAHTLDRLADEFSLLPIADAARAAFPSYDLDEAQAAEVRFGRRLDLTIDDLSAVFAPDGTFLALYRPDGDRARPEAVYVS